MSEMENTYRPDYAVHPGEYLAEILESRDIKKRDFAERIGLSVKAVSQIINAKALYSPETAIQLEKTLDVSAEIWMGLAESFQLFEAREKERRGFESKKTRDWIRRFPLVDMKRLGILPRTSKPEILADRILRFLNAAAPETWDDYQRKKAVSYRKSTAFTESPEATVVWLRLAEREAEKIETIPYDKSVFRETLEKIRKLTGRTPDDFLPKMTELCRAAGIAAVFLPELKGTHLSGASEWISPQKAMIAVSLRYKTNDHFWFTFFHEAAHILLHAKKSIFLDTKERGGSGEEREADEFSCGLLIPDKEYKNFIEAGGFYAKDISSFAEKIGIHPGIVVGRLQHDELIPFGWHNALKVKYEMEE